MERASAISASRLARRVGTRTRVLIDSVEDGVVLGRSGGEAPEIDGVVRLTRGRRVLRAGDWVDAEITATDAYDLQGRVVSSG
jgi:ribosomal protein S12 methylthiotransferase